MKWFLLALGWLTLAGAAQIRPGPTANSWAPAVAYHLRVLPNGLKVASVVDRSQSNVAVQLWYGVGSRDDPPGRAGFAHLIEHLMFRSTGSMPADYISRLTEDAGGDDNASTDSDYTEYDDLSPADRLPQILWAEAQRMSSLVVDEAGFRAEQAVVEQELKQEVLSDPYGPLFEFAIPKAGFRGPAYSHSPIGSMAELRAGTLQEVSAFHARYYRPDNAVLVVVGDFDEKRLGAWIDQFFGPIPRPIEPVPQTPPQQGPLSAGGRIEAAGQSAIQPTVVLCFRAPRAGGRDAAALKVANAMLTGDRHSRLYTSLVRDRGLASDVFSDVDLRQHAGMLDLGAMLASGKRLADGEAALVEAVSDLRARPTAAAELSAAKNQLRAKLLQDRETIEGLASQIGYATAVEGDVAHVNSDVEALRAVSPGDVQRVAKLYLADDRRVTLRYRSAQGAAPVAATALRTDRAAARPERPQPSVADPGRPKDLPPAAPGPTAHRAPIPAERVLPNGLRVIVARTGELPLATVLIRFRGGSALDPPGREGLTSLTASLGSQRSSGRTPDAILAGLGDTYGTSVDEEATTFSVTGLSNPREILPILAQAVRQRSIDEAGFQRARVRALDRAAQSLDDMDSTVDAAIARLIFGPGAHGRPQEGDPSSLARVTRQDVIRQHDAIYRPDNAVLVIAGDVDPQAVFGLAERDFAGWAKPSAPLPAAVASSPPPRSQVVLIDVPGLEEATVSIAGRSVGRNDPARYAVEVANGVLGGGFSSRLNQEIRVRRGLSYDVSSQVEALDDVGLFSATAQVEAGAAAEVAKSMLEQLRSISVQPPTASELMARKSALIGQALAATGTTTDLADFLADAALHGRGMRDLSDYLAGVSGVTAADVSAASPKLCDPNSVNIVVVADATLVMRELRRSFGKIQLYSQGHVRPARNKT